MPERKVRFLCNIFRKKFFTALIQVIIIFTVLNIFPITANTICPSRPNVREFFQQTRKRQYFYIDAKKGNDNWLGSFSSPNNRGNGPFKTMHGAIKGIRTQNISRPTTLLIKQGEYHVKKTIRLDERDSNLWIMGYPVGKRPLISGGYRIPGNRFVLLERGIYAARFRGKCSRHAFLGEKRLVRARKPNLKKWRGNEFTGEGPYLTIKDIIHPTPTCDRQGSGGFKQERCPKINRRGFIYQYGDIDPRWVDPKTGEIMIFGSWTAERGRISAIFDYQNLLIFQNKLRFPIGLHPQSSGWRYIVENIFEELDATGEFFCDQNSGVFYLIPPDGALRNEDVYISSTQTLFRVKNAQDIRFSDLAFRYSSDNNIDRYNTRPAMLDFDKTNGVVIDRCSFSNVGQTAIFLTSSINVMIYENKFYDVGFIAVSMEFRSGPDDPMATRNVVIYKNTFEGCGITNMLQPCCIQLMGVGDILVIDNDISRISYAGIRVGWQPTFTAQYVPKGTYVFRIEQNNIHDYGMGILSDFGGVYLSSNPGCGAADRDLTKCHLHAYVAYNTIHHSSAYRYGAIGVYSDTTVGSITVENNWLHDLRGAAINFHCGQHNFALNNMIHHVNDVRVFGTCNAAVGPGNLPRQVLTFKQNVVYVASNQSRMFGRSDVWVNDIPEVDNNIYFFEHIKTARGFFPKDGLNFSDKGRSWREWRQETGNDLKSRIINPQFWNILTNDFRLKKTSPAFRIGIESTDLRNNRRNNRIC